ncbi:hypothetical protein KKF84_01365 [Myxococcota bacterium]|nr:hypothetical protein [Myxococcota bacterium]
MAPKNTTARGSLPGILIPTLALICMIVFALLTSWYAARERVKLAMRPHLILAQNHMKKIRNALVRNNAPIFLREKWEVGADKDVMESELKSFSELYFVDQGGLSRLFKQVTTFTKKYAEIKNEKDFQDVMTQQKRDNALARTHEIETNILNILKNFSDGGFLMQGFFLFLSLLSGLLGIFFYRR